MLIMKILLLNGFNKYPVKRYQFIFEFLSINGKNLPILKLASSFASSVYILEKTFNSENFFNKSKNLKSRLSQIFKTFEQNNRLNLYVLKLVGTGYKAITPKKFFRRILFLRVGFAASELKYSLLNTNLRMRARKQKIILFGFQKPLLSQIGHQIINLRYPNAYTGKGIKEQDTTFYTKARKQQQRGK